MPIKIAIDARLFSRSMTGDTSYWRGLIHALVRQESDIELFLVSNNKRPQEIPESERVHWIELVGSDRMWSLVKFPLFARKIGADVVHVQYSLSPLVGKKGVTTVHDVSFFIGPQWFSTKDRLLLQRSVPAAIRRAARVFAVSQTACSEIEQFVPEAKGKTVVTFNALGDNIQVMDEAKALEVVARIGVEPPYVFSVGTRWPRKNLSLAVEAAQLAGQKLVVSGKKGWGPESTNAMYTGYVSDVELTALYQCASLYLAPSYHEGFGIPLLEAFACGCPVICSPGGAMPEVAGGAAVVMDNFDPAEWAKHIQALLRDSSKLDAMDRLGRERVKDFSWESTAQLTAKTYKQVARGH